MLNIGDFHVIDGCVLFYESANHYYISEGDYNDFCLVVERLDENGDIVSASYGCTSISVAIASIEALENGEEI